jgi:acetyl CoA:N6-hydroxylysine acetyl transferase
MHTLPLPNGQCLQGDESPDALHLQLDLHEPIHVRLTPGEPLRVAASEALSAQALWWVSYWLFARDETCQTLQWQLPAVAVETLRSGLLNSDADGVLTTERTAFWQLAEPWLLNGPSVAYPQQLIISDGKRHPRRPPKPTGELYRRFDTRLGSWISLRALDIDSDLQRFSRWQNSPRVLEFWQEGGTLEQHRQYLEKLERDPHTLTLIGCFDDQPFAYFEAYWAKEDRIAPFYAAGNYDRGIHMLVGEENQRGPHKVASWLTALTHFLFLDEPRTQRVVAEPRADNARMIGHMHSAGFHCEKEFDFPHKRAALMAIDRERFFDRCALR